MRSLTSTPCGRGAFETRGATLCTYRLIWLWLSKEGSCWGWGGSPTAVWFEGFRVRCFSTAGRWQRKKGGHTPLRINYSLTKACLTPSMVQEPEFWNSKAENTGYQAPAQSGRVETARQADRWLPAHWSLRSRIGVAILCHSFTWDSLKSLKKLQDAGQGQVF